MMKKIKYLIPLMAFGLLVTSCSNANPLSGAVDTIINNSGGTDINVPWEDYDNPLTSFSFNDGQDPLTKNKGETHTYEYNYAPRGAQINWSTNDPTVATIEDGVLTAVGKGSTTVVVSGSERSTMMPVMATVNVVTPLKDFTVSNKSFSLDYGEKAQIEVTFDPVDTSEDELNYQITTGEDFIHVSDSGLITAKNSSGHAVIRVSSPHINKVEEVTVDVSDKATYISSLTLTATDLEASNKLEINKTASISASILPENATYKTITYHSTDDTVISVDINTGAIKALREGKAKVYASVYEERKLEDFKSNEIEITVYEVKTTALLLHEDTFNLNNKGAVTGQIEFDYSVDMTERTRPSISDIAYSSADTNIATVSATGLISAVGSGSTTITVTERHSGVTATVTVNVTILSTSVNVVANPKTELYVDESVTLTATVLPSGVTDNSVTWNIEKEDKLSYTISGNKLTINSATEEGTYHISASNGGLTSNEITLNYYNRPGEFMDGFIYLVGNRDFSSRVSVNYRDSWMDSNRALVLSDDLGPGGNADVQLSTQVRMFSGDEFKIRENSDGWLDTHTESGDHYEHSGAISSGAVTCNTNVENANFVVTKTGWYRLIYKIFDKGATKEWHSLYIEEYNLEVDSESSLQLSVGEDFDIGVSQWHAQGAITDFNVTVEDPTVASATKGVENCKVKVTGLKVGETTLRINDGYDYFDIEISVLNITKRSIYVNANGMFDADDNVIFAHAWDTHSKQSYKMSKVEGKETIYTAKINEAYTKILFARCPEGTTELILEGEGKNYNNKTDYLDIQSDKDMWTMDEWQEATPVGSWSVYDPSQSYNIFKQGAMYMVGNRDYSTMVSTPGTSWNNPDQALMFTSKYENGQQYMKSVKLEVNDKFRFRSHSDEYPTVEYENYGAYAAGDITLGTGEDANNLVVHNKGVYDIYFKVSDTGAFSLYMERQPSLTLNPTALNLVNGGSDVVTASNFTAPLAVSGYSSSILTVTVNNDKINVTANATGETTITVTDAEGYVATCLVNVTAEPIDESTTYVYIQDQTGSGWTYQGMDATLHMWDITFDTGSPYSSFADLKAAGANLGGTTTYGSDCVDVVMTWKNEEGNNRQYEVTIPWFIKSFKACFQAGNRYVFDHDAADSYRINASKGNNYKVYMYGSYNWSGNNVYTNISLA